MITGIEKDIYEIIQELRCAQRNHIVTILKEYKGASVSATEKAITKLVQNRYVFWSADKKLLLATPREKAYKNTIDSLNVLCDVIRNTNIKLEKIYKPNAPASVGYINKSHKIFEIIAPSSNETASSYADLVEKQYIETLDSVQQNIRYIFIIKNKEEIKQFPKEKISYPYAFALVDYKADDGISFRKVPTVTYITPKED